MLCDLFDEVGPHAPTLSGDWDTHHLVAHLALRESHPLDFLRVALPATSKQAVDELVATVDFAEVVRRVRRGPAGLSPFALPQVDRNANALEFFVHHEDVRRAALRWSPRDLGSEAQDEIWARIRLFAKVLLRRAPVGVELARTDAEGSSRAAKGSDTVVVRGLPGELTLFAFGRSDVAKVELDGPPAAVTALRAATLES